MCGLTNKVRSSERSEPRPEPFVGRPRIGAELVGGVENCFLRFSAEYWLVVA